MGVGLSGQEEEAVVLGIEAGLVEEEVGGLGTIREEGEGLLGLLELEE